MDGRANQCEFPSHTLFVAFSLSPSLSLSLSVSLSLSIYLSICLSVYLSVCLSTYLSTCLSAYLPTYLPTYISISLSIYLSVCLSACLPVCLSVCLSVWLSVLSICLSVFLSVYQSICHAVYLCICLCLSISHFDFERCFVLQRCAFFRRLTIQKWSERGVSHMLTSKCVSCHHGAYKSGTSHFDFHMFFASHLGRTFSTSQPPKVARHRQFLTCLTYDMNVLRATAACNFWTCQLPKMLRTHNPFLAQVWTCWLRRVLCATKRALFWGISLLKYCSENGLLCTFWLRNALRAAAACTFSTSQLSKLVRTCVFVSAFWLRNRLRATTACNVWSLIRPHGSAPTALSSLLFDPPKPQNIGKVVCLHLLSTDSFSSDSLSLFSLSSLTALTAVAASVHKSKVWLLNVLRLCCADCLPHHVRVCCTVLDDSLHTGW